ncbi:hypothetical protein ACE400_29970, partial [Salmonella enterica]|uniref:hypothetical protein n=1 Tax=Salmonella enterica TaxID=28901 RepID=UPI003D268444
TASMLLGALVQTLGIGKFALESFWTRPDGHIVAAATSPGAVWKQIGIWYGAPLLVAASLLSFAFQWRTILRSFSGLASAGA